MRPEGASLGSRVFGCLFVVAGIVLLAHGLFGFSIYVGNTAGSEADWGGGIKYDAATRTELAAGAGLTAAGALLLWGLLGNGLG